MQGSALLGASILPFKREEGLLLHQHHLFYLSRTVGRQRIEVSARRQFRCVELSLIVTSREISFDEGGDFAPKDVIYF